MDKFEITYSPDVIGKDEKALRNGPVWITKQMTKQEVFDIITKQGYATTANHKDGQRGKAYFVSRQIIMLDVDNADDDNGGISIKQMTATPLYLEYAAGFYTTPSHQESSPRYRVIFLLEEALQDVTVYEAVVKFLLTVVPQADKACSDCSRVFYGSVQAKQVQKINGYISKQDVEDIVGWFHKKQRKHMTTPMRLTLAALAYWFHRPWPDD